MGWQDSPEVAPNAQIAGQPPTAQPAPAALWSTSPEVGSDQSAQQPTAQSADDPRSTNWSDLPSNLLPSLGGQVGQIAGGIGSMVAHPINTFNNLNSLATGEALKFDDYAKSLMPDWLRKANDTVNSYADYLPGGRTLSAVENDPQLSAQDKNMASAVNQDYIDAYGSSEARKKTLINDPFRPITDLSMLASGAGAALDAIPAASKIAKIASVVGDATNPLSVATKGVSAVAKSPVGSFAKNVAADLITKPSGVGGDAIQQAIKDGASGGDQGAAFRASMRGPTDNKGVVDDALAAIDKESADSRADYNSRMAATKANQNNVSWGPINDAMNGAVDKMYHGDISKVSPEAIDYATRLAEKLDEFQKTFPNPKPYDLDQLKQAIGSIDNGWDKTKGKATDFRDTMYGAVKSSITNADPTYAATMDASQAHFDRLKDLKDTLSLNGDNTNYSTALKKLQSVYRNNVNTNYGDRLDAVKSLSDNAPNLMSSLAGQQFNSIMPRGLASKIAELGGGALAVTHPGALAAAPLFIPRAMGELAHGLGRAYGAASSLSPIASPAYRTLARTAIPSGRVALDSP